MARRRRKPAAGARVQGRSPCLEAVGMVNTVKPRPRKHGRNALNEDRECARFFLRPSPRFVVHAGKCSSAFFVINDDAVAAAAPPGERRGSRRHACC